MGGGRLNPPNLPSGYATGVSLWWWLKQASDEIKVNIITSLFQQHAFSCC